MNSRWLWACLIGALALLCASCEDDKNCDSNDADYCSVDAATKNVCRSGKWVTIYCDAGTACAYVGGKPQCIVATPAEEKCVAGEKRCAADGIAISCEDLTGGATAWRYEVCDALSACKDGVCASKITPEAENGIKSQQCAPDGKGVETVYADGTKKTQTCSELVGFDADCRTYSGGLVGCAMPQSCDESVFSESGTCFGNILRACDTRYTVARPTSSDCAQLSQTCAVVSGKASCRDACAAPDPNDVKCDGYAASRCVADASGANVVESAESLCIGDDAQVSCAAGQAVQKTCGEGAKCIASIGQCIDLCAQSDLNAPKCDADGKLSICRAVGGIYGYVPVGKRECLGDTLITCQSADGAYSPKQTNCREYVHTDGKTYFAHCQSDYQGYGDYDVCVPAAEGESCGDMTADGVCAGSTLSYCLAEDDVIINKNCAGDSDGYTACSVYQGYADCRKPCRQEGAASCAYSSSSQSHYVQLCAPSEAAGGDLTVIEATSVCLGNTLYACDGSGKPTTADCAANGGVCDGTACAYPLCAADLQPKCTTKNELLSCQISETGEVLGLSLQTVSCSPDGTCRSCKDGKVVTAAPN